MEDLVAPSRHIHRCLQKTNVGTFSHILQFNIPLMDEESNFAEYKSEADGEANVRSLICYS